MPVVSISEAPTRVSYIFFALICESNILICLVLALSFSYCSSTESCLDALLELSDDTLPGGALTLPGVLFLRFSPRIVLTDFMYSSNVYKISWLHAISIGDFPSEFLENRVGCFVSKNLKQSLWPYSATKWQGVFPSISLASTSAPEIKRV